MGVWRKILVTHMEVLWAAERRRFQEASRFQVSCTLANFVHKCSFAGAFIFSNVASDSTIRLLSRASKTQNIYVREMSFIKALLISLKQIISKLHSNPLPGTPKIRR